nr:MAG TPA: hypothetical protein [Caudoviricetes sp.]
MGGAPQSNGAPRVRDPDAVPMAMTSARICPRTPGRIAGQPLPAHLSTMCPMQGFLNTQATGVDKKKDT